MRLCGRDIGLSPQVLRTLEVLLSCLAPKRNHHVVFASNATLVSRSGGLSERSIRRHIAQLVKAGLAERSESANGKRYSHHDPVAGMTMRFGLDFTRLFRQFSTFASLADVVEKRQRQLRYLRCKLRAACQRILSVDPQNTEALDARNAARRNLSAAEYQKLLSSIPVPDETPAIDNAVNGDDMATCGGQNDRHQSNFSIEYTEKETPENLPALLNHCSEAQNFALEPVHTADDIIEHAQKLAPMIGIAPDLWHKAIQTRSRIDIAASVWLIVQNLSRITKPAAYFRAITTGKSSAGYSPWRWLLRQINSNCPRTI